MTTVVDSADARTLPAGRASRIAERTAEEALPTRRLVVLSGRAGAGKTDVLRALARCGAQVIDLELLACHRGSAFGGLGQPAQPSHAAFHTQVMSAWRTAQVDQPLFIEEEGEYLGGVGVPRALLLHMQRATRIPLETPLTARVARLGRDYGGFPLPELEAAVRRAAPRIGRSPAASALAALGRSDVESAIRALLSFYDRAYAHYFAERESPRVLACVDGSDPVRAADAIMSRTRELVARLR